MYRFLRRLLMFLSVATLAEYSWVVHLGPFRSTPNKMLTVMLLGMAVVGAAIEPRRLPRNAKTWWIAAFFGSVCVSVIYSLTAGVPSLSLIQTVTSYAAVVLFYFVIVWALPEEKDVRVLLWGLALGTALVCLSALLGVGKFSEGATWTRSSGFGGNPNRMGYMASAALPLMAALILSVRGAFAKAVLMGCALVTVAGVMASLSRTAFVMIAVMGTYAMLRFGRLDLVRYAPIPLLLGVAVLFLAPDQAYQRAATMTTPESIQRDSSIQGRLRDWKYASLAFLSNPITGVGFYRFGVWANENVDYTIHAGKAIHSAYFRVAADQGLLGLVPYLGILAATWYDFWRSAWLARRFRRRRDPQMHRFGNYALFGEAALVGTLVGNLACPSVTYKITWLLCALSTALLALIRKRAAVLAEEPEEEASADLVPFEGALATSRGALAP